MSLATDLEMLEVLKEIRDLLKAQAPAKPVEPFIPPAMNKFNEYLKTMPQLNSIGDRCVDDGSHKYTQALALVPCLKCGKVPGSMIATYNEDMTPKG